MDLSEVKIDDRVKVILQKEGISELRPAQAKAIAAGLLDHKSILVCTPTASGKTLVAELAFMNTILEKKAKAIYVVPLKALGSEKYSEFKRKYSNLINVGLTIGDFDSSDPYLHTFDLIVTTSEKFDSLIRHKVPWLKDISLVIVDEIHLLNDPSRGPTLEIVITILKQMKKNIQILGLSATIGNESELADWLGADLVQDSWRPVALRKGVYHDGVIEFDN
jgi:helicase